MFAMAASVTLLYSTEVSVLMFLLIGIAAGAATGIPIGPVNVAVIDAAYRHTMRRAIAVGFGGAVADIPARRHRDDLAADEDKSA